MNLQLAGKRALVTGGSGGIGSAIARALAYEGAAVAVHGRDAPRVKQVAGAIVGEGGAAHAIVGDLADDAGAEAVAREALAALGGVDILVNNAGGADGPQQGWDAAPADWERIFQQNLFSAMRLVRRLTPAMRAAGWGRVVNIASGWAVQPAAIMPHYAAAKAALVNATVSLARELAGTGVTANTVSPALIRTPALERGLRALAREKNWGMDDWAEIERHFLREVMPNSAGRIGQPEDVAHLVAFLASPLAGYIDGANLRVDGGAVTAIAPSCSRAFATLLAVARRQSRIREQRAQIRRGLVVFDDDRCLPVAEHAHLRHADVRGLGG